MNPTSDAMPFVAINAPSFQIIETVNHKSPPHNSTIGPSGYIPKELIEMPMISVIVAAHLM